jgi:hypothetical protein
VEQELLTLPKHLISLPVVSGFRVTRFLVLCVCFAYRRLCFCTFSFGHCVVNSSSIYGFWLTLWYLQTLLMEFVERGWTRIDNYHYITTLSTGIYCNIIQMTQHYNVIYETKQTVSVEISLTGLTLLYCCAYAWPRFLSGDVMFFVCLLDCDDRLLLS